MLKRVLDLIGSIVGLILVSPILAIVSVLIRWRLGPPVLFRQERLGLREHPFEVIKFRTMTNERGPDGNLLPDADRLPAFGRRLRAASLDELPELWNVVRGDMSLVGPRPLPVQYRHRFKSDERVRHTVRPGITGWAQVQGRNMVDWDDRLAMDVWYARNQSVWLDLRILARTVRAVLARRGISAKGEATMPVLRPEIPDQREDP
jgi:lipopolysaccharide/colanic/teichoic acid biosynthesis glycosyltransferase